MDGRKDHQDCQLLGVYRKNRLFLLNVKRARQMAGFYFREIHRKSGCGYGDLSKEPEFMVPP